MMDYLSDQVNELHIIKPRDHSERSVKEYRVDARLLRDMTDDLVKISEHLHYHIMLIGVSGYAERQLLAPILAAAWRYKRPGR
jgi:hypothetical protein